jgi:hypothetical protein
MQETLESTPTDNTPLEINGDDLRRAAEALDRTTHSIDDSIADAGIKSVMVPDNEVSVGPKATTAPTAESTTQPDISPAPTDPLPSTQSEPTPATSEFWADWENTLNSLHKEHPDMTKKDSALFRTASSFLDSKDPEIKRMLYSTTKGARYAVELARMKLEADRAPSLIKENAELKARIKEQDRKLAPSAAVPAAGPQTKNFDQMNFKEQGAYLRRLAMEEDGLV